MTAINVPAGTLPQTGVWNIDSMHSTVTFSIRHHAVARFRAGFNKITGSYDASEQKLSGEVQVAEIDLPIPPLKNHLLSPAFFNAEEFPAFSFVSTAITPGADGVTVAGELTLCGITKPVTATGTVAGPQHVEHGGDRGTSVRLGIDLSTTIDRREWGLDFNNEVSAGIANLGWDVKIDAALELILG